MHGLGPDLRHALRRLRRSPSFTAVALLTLALGIGANAALFSVVHAVLLEPLPFAEPERLYWIWSRHTSTDRYPFQLPEFCDYRDRTGTLQGLAGVANWSASLTGEGPAERLNGLRVSGGFFDLLGTKPALGRTLRPDDDTPGRQKVAVLSHGLWERRFGGDPAILGRGLVLNGEVFTVVGVTARSFVLPIRLVDVVVPLAPDADPWRENRTSTHFIRGLGRAKPGVSREQIVAELDGIAASLQREFPKSYARKLGVRVVPIRDELTRNVRPALLVLLGAVGLLLLIACANLANLMLVRAGDRRRELAVRRALGAGDGLLVREVLVESLLVAAAGAALGTLLAHWAVPALVALSPTPLPRGADIGGGGPVLAFAAGAAVFCALLFGLLPARHAARSDPSRELQAEGRGSSGSVERSRTRALVMTAQLALMTVLLSGAGLLLKSFEAVMRVDPGFDPGVLTLRLSLPRKDYASPDRMSAFYRDLEARVAKRPGVQSVAAVNQVPLNGALASADYKVQGRPPAREDQLPTAQYRMITPAYFRTMGIPLLAGRAFDDRDRTGAPLVAVVSRALARHSFPDRDPVGQVLLVADTPDGFRAMEIVGVAGDVKHQGLENEADAHLYVPYHQAHPALLVWLSANQFLAVRAAGSPLALAEAVRADLAAVDSSVAAADPRLSGSYVEAASGARRFSLLLLGLFAAVGLLLAGVGIFGVVSYSVAQRTRETGVRLALGATATDILALVVGQSLGRAALGIAAGLLAALPTGLALRSQLYGVAATDPVTYGAVVLVLLAVALVACAQPAWRAARSSPLEALRQD